MFLLTVVLVVLAALLWILMLEVNLEKSLTIISKIPRHDLFTYLSTPVNLERCHPTFFKISNVEKENDALVFTAEEDLGGLIGSNKVPVRVMSYNNASSDTSHVQMDFYSNLAIVTVNVTISDFNSSISTYPVGKTAHSFIASETVPGNLDVSETEACNLAVSKTACDQIPFVMVHILVKVQTWRVLSDFISGHAFDAWNKTIRKAVDIQGQQSLQLVYQNRVNQP